MKAFYQPVRQAARIGFFLAAWILFALVFVQVFHAGSAVLVNPGNWDAHRSLGHMIALPIMAMFSPADAGAVAAGQKIAQQRCIACHAADFKGQQLGATRSADLTQASVKRTEQFLMWAITNGSQKGMPGWGALPEEQRWQLVTFVKTLRP